MDENSLESSLNYSFKNQKLLEEAMHHPSYAKTTKGINRKAFERLEFLGDRVLGLVISKTLFLKNPRSPEGELVERYNHLVKGETLAKIASNLNLMEYLRYGRLLKGNAKQLQTIQADATEALLGAVFLDGGFKAAEPVILSLWAPYIESAAKVDNPKSTVQEWAQKAGYDIPVYTLLQRDGPDHNPCFEVKVEVGNEMKCAGQGQSKKQAEIKAAELFVKQFIENKT